MKKGDLVTIYNNYDFLKQVSSKVLESDKELNEDIEILEEYCISNDVFAMAAVQLGIPKRILYVKNTNLDLAVKEAEGMELTEEEKNHNEARIFINPTIIKMEGLTKYWENCASCEDNMGLVYRAYKVSLEYYDRQFNKHEEEFIGFPSTIIQHEYDHLDGILHMEKAVIVYDMPLEERIKFRKKADNDYVILNKEKDFNELVLKYKNE